MRQKAWRYYKNFLTWPVERQNRDLLRRPPHFWEEMGGRKALEVFHAAAERVPAYKRFLKENDVKISAIKTLEDFKRLPTVDKKNYLTRYPLDQLCWDGALPNMKVISCSSGSSGKPFFWPRDIWQEREVDHWYELTLKYLFEADQRRSLIVISFAMGIYIAGPFTYGSCLRIAQKGYPFAISTPSTDIPTVLRVIEELSGQFDQIILGGYPPLIKEILETGRHQGLDLAKNRIKLFFGGEGFSERWRGYIHKLAGIKSDFTSTINMYGTADSALLGIETPFSIAYRQLIDDNAEMRTALGNERLPSIVSYNPLLKYFETESNHSLLFTSSSGIPLIRYRIGDVGGTLSYASVSQTLHEKDKRLAHEVMGWKLPLVYLYGRDDFTVHVYGANVYPENIKEALEDHRVNKFVSGKFVMDVEDRKDMSQEFEILIELAPGIAVSQEKTELIQKIILQTLVNRNSEFANSHRTVGKKAEPIVKLDKHGSPHFQIKTKHGWVTKKG